MEEALYERNMIQFFRKKPSSLILKLVIEDTSWHAYHNPNPKKKSLHKWITKYLVGPKRKAMDPDAAFPIRAFDGFFFQIIVPDSRL